MNKGIKFALFTALISGLANFANKEIISAGTDPVLLTALKNIVPGIIFSAMALPLIPQIKKLKEIKIKPLEFEIKEFKLMKSTLTKDGPVYEELDTF